MRELYYVIGITLLATVALVGFIPFDKYNNTNEVDVPRITNPCNECVTSLVSSFVYNNESSNNLQWIDYYNNKLDSNILSTQKLSTELHSHWKKLVARTSANI